MFRRERRAIILAAGTLIGLYHARAAHSASFDCRAATTLVERLICTDIALSDQDERIASAYRAAMRATEHPADVLAAQRQWLRMIAACHDTACVASGQAMRLSQLEPMEDASRMASVADAEKAEAHPATRSVAPPSGYRPVMEIFVDDQMRPVFHGRTNLPDGAELILGLARPESGFMAQSKTKVVSGQFVTERFSQGGHALNPGRYRLDVSMGLAMFQPPAVRAVVGEHGEKMAGPLVGPSPIGPDEQVFGYGTGLILGGPADAELDAAARARSAEALRDWLAEGCAPQIDFVNAMVKSGALTGREVLGEERRRRIATCVADARASP